MSGKTFVASSDERREIAHMFRDLCGRDTMKDLFRTVGLTRSDGWIAFCDRIADLIEPEPERTARLKYDDDHGCNICTGCGERYEHGMYMAVTYDGFIAYKPMRYCPACGARLEGVGR